MDTFTIVLTEQEANALLHMIDLAVRNGGLTIAEAAVVLANKIKSTKPDQAVRMNGPQVRNENKTV